MHPHRLLISKTDGIDGLALYPPACGRTLIVGRRAASATVARADEEGASREDAYALVQPLAMRVWDEGANFHDLFMNDKRLTDTLSRETDVLFDVDKQLRNVDRYSLGFGE